MSDSGFNRLKVDYDLKDNKVFNYKNNYLTLKSRLTNSDTNLKSNKMQMTIWSITCSILILIILVLIRNIN